MGDWTAETVKELHDSKVADVERLLRAEIGRIEAVITGQDKAVELLRLTQTTQAQGVRDTRAAAIAFAGLVVAFALYWAAGRDHAQPVVVAPTVTAPSP